MLSSVSTEPNDARRWWILTLVGVAQLMVVLDGTIVNIALPSAQASLGFADDDRQWIVTAYALAFGSLLLLCGRIGDLFGRKRVFIVGLVGFAVASALGGAAGSFGLLVCARALQGAFGALLAPTALSLLTTTFTEPAERGRAFGVFGAIAGSGLAIGLLLGGLLTEYLSWRWCLYVNLVLALPVALGGATLLHDREPEQRPRLDLPGALLSGAGLVCLVYGFGQAEQRGWGDGATIGFLAAAVVLLLGFLARQARVPHPLLPLRVVADRDRGASFMVMALSGAGMFGVFLFLTYYLQQTLRFSPVEAGLAFLPMTVAIMVSSTSATTRLMPRLGHKKLVVGGMALTTIGMVLLTQIEADSAYAVNVLPGLVVVGVGLGCAFAPAMATATAGIAPGDAGVASATVNASQQVGGSIGAAFLSTTFASAVGGFVADHGAGSVEQASMHGYKVAFWWTAAIFFVGAVISALLFRGAVPAPDPDAAPAMARTA